LRLALASLCILGVLPAAAQETQPSPSEPPPPAGEVEGAPVPQRDGELPDFWDRLPTTGATTGEATPVRPYLGPLPVPPPESETMPADRPPTSILVGPYIPEGEIALPALGDEAAEDAPEGAEAEEPSETAVNPDAADAALAADISVDTLTSLSPAAIGAWSEGEGEPFPVDMWRGTTRDTLTTLIPELPMAVRSPVMRELARRLLLSPARLPGEVEAEAASEPQALAGPEESIANAPSSLDAEAPPGFPGTGISADPLETPATETDMRLLTLRLERLRAGGALRDLLALAERVPDSAMTEEILRLKTDALLVLGDYDAGCSAARDGVSQSGAAYWLRALAMCEALEGNRNAAFFRLNLLAETEESESGFSALVEALLAEIEGAPIAVNEDVLAAAERLDTVLFALSRLTRAPIPLELALSAEPLVLDALVELPDFDSETHLAIAEKALGLGLLGGETLREIYEAVPFTEAELARASEILEAARAEEAREATAEAPAEAETLDANTTTAEMPERRADAVESVRPPIRGLRLDALLYQRAVGAEDPEERLEWMASLVKRARKAERTFAVAEALVAPLSSVSAEPSLAPFADTAGRIHLTNGEVDPALRWYEAARMAADMGSGAARGALVRLWPLLVVTDRSRSVPYSRRMLELWWQGRGELDRAERLTRGDRLFALFEELEFDVPAHLRHAAMAAPHRRATTPPSTLWRQLIIAAIEERVGEAVLTTLAALGEAGSDAAQPAVTATAVGALTAVGLDAEARRLALESLVAAGF